MESLDIKNLIKNFFGMSLEKQVKFKEEIEKSYYRNKAEAAEYGIKDTFLIYKEFNELFGNYFDHITLYLNNKDKYENLNSTQRRFLRYKTLEELQWRANCHNNSETEEDKIDYFIYFNSVECESQEELKEMINSHFHPKAISNFDADEYIELYRVMEYVDQKEFLENLCSYYSYSYLSYMACDFPSAYNIIDKYALIIKDLLGEELYEFYNALTNEEKISIIDKIAEILNTIENRYEKDLTFDDTNAVKKQKNKTLYICQNNISLK